ncbi:MAG TPA: DNA repair protein RadA, partial [Acidimicrobiales bacterium]|nr:DNA repair protein RadA [Acidimicrobiales bacterium]
MSRPRTVHRCSACGDATPQWLGRCPTCDEWGTLVEERPPAGGTAATRSPSAARAVPLAEVDLSAERSRATGIGELDRVLGGGLAPGSVTLLGGEPGIGKSSLLLQAVAALAGAGSRCLLVTAEESAAQVRIRAERLGAVAPGLHLLAETGLPEVLDAVDQVAPDVLVVDSIQTVFDPEVGAAPGTVSQVRECAARLVREAKVRSLTTVLVGHVTKDGALAGPRVLEHLVDTVLGFEGDRHHALRLLRADKHRFGSTAELGLFEMTDRGLVGVPDPSGLFLADRHEGVAGSVVVPTVEGHRPLLVEVQALATESTLAMPRRTALGLDGGRLALLLAVLDRRAGLRFGKLDVHASAVGGVKLLEPGADLALALALASSLTGVAVGDDLVACGEVGLGGELRQVAATPRRLAEAARLGFRRAGLRFGKLDVHASAVGGVKLLE